MLADDPIALARRFKGKVWKKRIRGHSVRVRMVYNDYLEMAELVQTRQPTLSLKSKKRFRLYQSAYFKWRNKVILPEIEKAIGVKFCESEKICEGRFLLATEEFPNEE